MILLWVMSILMYLTWAIAQLEGYLALEIKTNAIYQTYVHDFQKTERTLLACEQGLLEPALVESSKPAAEGFADRCQIEALGPVESSSRTQGTPQQKYLYQIRAGNRIRIESTVVVDHFSGTKTRLNWQQLYY
jgi:hypothetical protein